MTSEVQSIANPNILNRMVLAINWRTKCHFVPCHNLVDVGPAELLHYSDIVRAIKEDKEDFR